MSVVVCPQCRNQVDGSLAVCIYCGNPLNLSPKAIKKTVRRIIILVTVIIALLVTLYQFAKPYLPEQFQFPQAVESQSNSMNPDIPSPSPTQDSTDADSTDLDGDNEVSDSVAIQKMKTLLAKGICSKESSSSEFFNYSEYPGLTLSDWNQGSVRQCQSATTENSVRHWVTIFGPELLSTYGKSLDVPVNSILIEGADWAIRSNYYGDSKPTKSKDAVVKGILSTLGGSYTLH